MASDRAHLWRLVSRLLAAMAVVLLLVWPVTFIRPLWLKVWHFGLIANRGHVGLIWANADFRVVADPPKSALTGYAANTIYLRHDAIVGWQSIQPRPGLGPTSPPVAVRNCGSRRGPSRRRSACWASWRGCGRGVRRTPASALPAATSSRAWRRTPSAPSAAKPRTGRLSPWVASSSRRRSGRAWPGRWCSRQASRSTGSAASLDGQPTACTRGCPSPLAR